MTLPATGLRLAPPRPDAAGIRLELIPALAASSSAARRHGLAVPFRTGADAYELRLPGIGGRYLAGIAAHAASHGWPATEVATLLAAVEDRAAMWIVCAPAAALRGAGLAGGAGAGRFSRAGAARWSEGRWMSASVPKPAGVRQLVAAGVARGAVCAAARSGGARPPAALVQAAARSGARTATMSGGLASALGAAWAVELLIAPALPAGSLVTLREHVAVSPRCGWCRAPLVGAICRRCMPAAGG